MKPLKNVLFPAIGFATLLGALVLSGLQPQLVRGDDDDDDDEAQVNVAQDTGASGFSCSSAAFIDTDLEVILETKGRPVLVMFTVVANFSANTNISLQPTIDGSPEAGGITVSHLQGSPQGATETLSYSRVFLLDRGEHTFRVQCAAQGSVPLSQHWLTVYELIGSADDDD